MAPPDGFANPKRSQRIEMPVQQTSATSINPYAVCLSNPSVERRARRPVDGSMSAWSQASKPASSRDAHSTGGADADRRAAVPFIEILVNSSPDLR